jgi:hypothetical protein
MARLAPGFDATVDHYGPLMIEPATDGWVYVRADGDDPDDSLVRVRWPEFDLARVEPGTRVHVDPRGRIALLP